MGRWLDVLDAYAPWFFMAFAVLVLVAVAAWLGWR